MDPTLLALLDEPWRAGDDNDARETERPRRMLNITPDTGRLLWSLTRARDGAAVAAPRSGWIDQEPAAASIDSVGLAAAV